MMRRSGVSPLVNFSKLAREMLRLAASGHSSSTQVSKRAAAARIALACISGWPDEPDSPLHGGGGSLATGVTWTPGGPCVAGAEILPTGTGEGSLLGCVTATPALPSSSAAPSTVWTIVFEAVMPSALDQIIGTIGARYG